LFADDNSAGAYTVTLTVTDTYGASTSVSTGGLTLDQIQIPNISVANWAPVVSVLNQEVLAGSEINLNY
jgi:PKD repeat protein